MPRLSKLLILLPCHSLEDFPIHHRGEPAANLLACWTTLWHPALIASCQRLPEYHSADDCEIDSWGVSDDKEQGKCLVLIPDVAEAVVSSRLLMNMEDCDAIVISGKSNRAEIVSAALKASEHASSLSANINPVTADKFFALGYAYLQVQLMTRQLRYSSNLDDEYFSKQIVAAATAATKCDMESVERHLTACFDVLLEEKNNYYPVESELCDVVLTAPTTLSKSLERQLDVSHPQSILLTGSTIKILFSKYPETANRLVAAVAEQRVTVVGGLEDELPFPLMSSESNLHQLELGRATNVDHFAVSPKSHMRRTYGMTLGTPGILEQLEFLGTVLPTLDDGKVPISSSSDIRWNGEGERSIMAFGAAPLSAVDAGSMLGLGVRLGEMIDSAHTASLIFVHWPGDTCEAFQDLIRVAEYGGLLGRLVGVNEYFESRYDPGFGETYGPEEFRSPYLKQAVDSNSLDPISRVTRYWKRIYEVATLRCLLVLACGKRGVESESALEWLLEIETLQSATEMALSPESQGPNDSQIQDDKELELRIRQLARRLGSCDWHSKIDGGAEGDPESATCVEWFNPCSFKRLVACKTRIKTEGTLKSKLPPVLCDPIENGSYWIAEIPPMGLSSISAEQTQRRDAFKSDPVVQDSPLLRNEFFELLIDTSTGGIKSIHTYGKRGNQVGQQLAMRIPGESRRSGGKQTMARYTKMVADEIKPITVSRIAGSVVACGRIVDGDEMVARYRQTVSVSRASRLIDVQIELDYEGQLSQSVNHYLCSRLAWKDESAQLNANSAEVKHAVHSVWFLATHFVEIECADERVTLLTGGLPYHRRVSRRMLDTVLVVGREQQRKFSFAIAVNEPYAFQRSVDWMTPMVTMESAVSPEIGSAPGWLFHLDCRNILATWWEPIFTDAGRWTGVKIRLQETEGRGGKLCLRCPQTITSAERHRLGGGLIGTLNVSDDDASKLEIEFGRYEYFQISIHWKT